MPAKQCAARSRSPGPEAYWDCSTRPLTSLALVVPILLLYEVGILRLGPEAVRNAADVWLRQLLDLLGFGQYFLLPLLSCAILLGWHHLTRYRWYVSADVLAGMLLESAVLALLLLAIAQVQGWLFLAAAQRLDWLAVTATQGLDSRVLILGVFGAGLYEELLFRLMLLPAVFGILQWAGESRRASWVGAIVASSILFSAAHFQLLTPDGDPFTWFSFLFRALAGVFFGLLFLYRGFGITVGAHALYDILVGVLS